jgi:tetratricopeptide (TPR) repeat protein
VLKLERAILDSFPMSLKAYEITRDRFYDGLYPIWRDDTLKVEFLDGFLGDYPVNDWRLTVYQFLFSSLKRLEDMKGIRSYGERMLAEDSLNPFAYDYLSYLLLEAGIDTVRALELALKAVEMEPSYEKPRHKPDAHWELEKPPLAATARREVATALTALGRLSEAKVWAMEALDCYTPEVSNFSTRASLFYTLGRIQELRGEKEDAMDSFTSALIEGDMTNKWTLKADSSLRDLYLEAYGSENGLMGHARMSAGYRGITFTDVTEEVGLGGRRESRIAWADFNNDGYDEILLGGRVLFLNCSGDSFRDFTDSAGIGTSGVSGAVCADFDNDGNMDFYAISGGKRDKTDRLWKGNGDGTFVDVTSVARDVTDTLSTEGAAWGDYDLDGYVDLYCANYEVWGEVSGLEDRLYHNNGDGTFSRVGRGVGIEPPFGEDRAGRGVNWGDFDNDGDPDIFVSNYRLHENFLFRNNGDGTFNNVAVKQGVAGDETDGWWGHTIGSEWGDFDNDGDLDLVTANLAHPRYIEFSDKTRLYENTGAPEWAFVDRRESSGIKYDETHSDPSWGDVDGDGDLDLYITSIYEERRSFLYENLGEGRFRDITWLSGVRAYNGWGCAFSDFDNDGDLDLFVASGSGGHLFENDGHGNNWIAVSLVGGEKSNRGCVGARVVVSQGERRQVREVQGGKGTTSQHSLVQFFGLGGSSERVDIRVRFPSGKVEEKKDIEVNQRLVIKEE